MGHLADYWPFYALGLIATGVGAVLIFLEFQGISPSPGLCPNGMIWTTVSWIHTKYSVIPVYGCI